MAALCGDHFGRAYHDFYIRFEQQVCVICVTSASWLETSQSYDVRA